MHNMAGDTLSRLQSIITPELLKYIHDTALPRPGASAEELFKQYDDENHGEDLARTLYLSTFHSIFIPLSQIPLADWPSELKFLLPTPGDLDFPVHACSLIILLDQVPRRILKRHNRRWAFGFFDQLAQRLAKELDDLPGDVRLDNLERWFAADSTFTWADAMLRRSILLLSMEHAEDSTFKSRVAKVHEEIRQMAEEHYNRPDPTRTDPRVSDDNVTSLPRLVSEPMPPPYLDATEHADYFFFQALLNRCHAPPLKEFKRYPWRNAILGREDTREEAEYLGSIVNFNPTDPDVTEDIRRDVQAGVFRPLYDTSAT